MSAPISVRRRPAWSAERARDRGPRAVEGCDDAGLRGGEAARLREVDRQERHDEAARAIDQHAGPQHPERPRQAGSHVEGAAAAGFERRVHGASLRRGRCLRCGRRDHAPGHRKIGLRLRSKPEPEDFSVSVALGHPVMGSRFATASRGPLRGRHLHRTKTAIVQWITSFSGPLDHGGTQPSRSRSPALVNGIARGVPREGTSPNSRGRGRACQLQSGGRQVLKLLFRSCHPDPLRSGWVCGRGEAATRSSARRVGYDAPSCSPDSHLGLEARRWPPSR